MTDARPDPDDLLKRVQEQEARAKRGKLKIFFGAAPGVGKTYAMLSAAREKVKEGVDLVIGYVQPHMRPETQALVLGLELLPQREIDYRGTHLFELDVAAAIARRPQIVVVDELAHTNAADEHTVTHDKRWKDVNDLLDAGIDVYTTLNVQHLESLNDVIARITGVRVRETVPDLLFESADEVELVDLPPDDLLERLKEGKVYVADQARRATENFFRKGNLIALRELALRRTADRVNAQMQDWRAEYSVSATWATAERLLVCVGPSPSSAQVIRGAAQIASRLKARWVAVHVETTDDAQMGAAAHRRLTRNLALAEQLGAETAILPAGNAVEEILRFARQRNVNRIIVGKPNQPRWREWFRQPFVYELTRRCGDIDVYVISGDAEPLPASRTVRPAATSNALGYVWAVVTVALCTGIGFVSWPHFAALNLVMVYLLGVVAVSLKFGRGPSCVATLLSVAAFDVFFIPPFWTFAVSDIEYLFTFAVMLATGLIISSLTGRVNFQVEAARQREQRTATLYAMSRELASLRTRDEIVPTAERKIREVIDADLVILLPDDNRRFLQTGQSAVEPQLTERDCGVAQWVLDHGERAGLGSDTLAGADAAYFPLPTLQSTVGVLRVKPRQPNQPLRSDQVDLLETMATLTALAIERLHWSKAAERARLEIETERLRNSLLSAVSHDLRTPLATIVGSSSTLVEVGESLTPQTRRELAEAILEQGERLNRQVANLLDMTRLDEGSVELHKEWQPLEEVVGVVLSRLSKQLKDHPVRTHLSSGLPAIPMDGLLIQQTLINLLENAIKYGPSGKPIDLLAYREGSSVIVEVADYGPGLPEEDRQRVFEKFYRAANAEGHTGVGLGLSICRSIVALHGGTIWAENRPGGGLSVRFSLPVPEAPPGIPLEE